MSSDESYANHPVWEVYDELRTARLNVEYYELVRSRINRYSEVIEYVLAATASGSAIAAFSVWQTEKGAFVWGGLTALSALLAVLKPVAKFPDKRDKIDSVLPGYREIEHDLRMLSSNIRFDQTYSIEHREEYRRIMDYKKDLLIQNPGLTIRKRLKSKCAKLVNQAYPNSSLYIPEKYNG